MKIFDNCFKFVLVSVIIYCLCNITKPTISAAPVNKINSKEVKKDIKNKENKKKETKKKEVKKKTYRMSYKGHSFIKKYESCKLKAYKDGKGTSIGWGHQLRKGENFKTISQAKADQLFNKDVQWVNNSINRLLGKLDNRFRFSQGFIDGFGSFIYNCGEGGAKNSKFYKALSRCRFDGKSRNNINKKDYEYALNTIKSSCISAKGHYARREGEYKLMMN